MLRFLTAGESHGPGLVTIVEGLPAGLEISSDGLAEQLRRRRLGFGRGRRMRIEQDELEILGGVRHGRTLGSPLAIVIRNSEWAKWSEEMSPETGQPKRVMATPRPGHADLSGMLKYDTHDARDILERASARETAARTVAGYASSQLLGQIGISVLSHVVAIGPVAVPAGTTPGPGDLEAIDESPVRVFARGTEAAMTEAIEQAKADRDTLGGVVEVLAFGVPAGVGSHVHWDRRLDTRLAAALMSIQGIKAVEMGDGFASAARPGSEAHDEIGFTAGEFVRTSDRAGGLEGGISTGQTLRMRAAMKPISTLMRPLQSVNVESKESAAAFRERSDVCAVPAAGVVAEQMVAYVLAAEAIRKFGGDTVADLAGSVDAYRNRLLAY